MIRYCSQHKEKFLARPPWDASRCDWCIYQWACSWKVDDVGNAGVFDNAALGTEADVFLRAFLILCPPHTILELRSTLRAAYPPPSAPLPRRLPPSFPPFRRPSLQPLLHASNGGTSLPWQPFSSHCNLSRNGKRASGERTRVPPPTCGSVQWRAASKIRESVSTLCQFHRTPAVHTTF